MPLPKFMAARGPGSMTAPAQQASLCPMPSWPMPMNPEGSDVSMALASASSRTSSFRASTISPLPEKSPQASSTASAFTRTMPSSFSP